MSAPEHHFEANLQRGELLRHQGRYAEAEKFLQAAIAQEPSRAEGYYQLAFCYCDWHGHGKQAINTIDRAISLDPNQGEYFALRAWILVNLDRDREALRVAAQALALQPFCLLALNARTRAHISLSSWAEAETSARATLQHFPRSDFATNLLAVALRQQGRRAESDAVTAGLLARTPNNAMAHSNAGWSALQAGDHRRANLHFLEALRISPNFDYARRGLLHSFSARVWLYRLYFKFLAWMGSHQKAMRYFLVFVIYVVYRMIFLTLRDEFGREGLHWGGVLVALYFVIMGFGRSFGNLFLQLDPFARHALTWKERGWSYFAGVFYSLFIAYEAAEHAWLQLAVLLFIPGCFLWGVLFPRVRAALAREESPEDAAAENG